MSEEKVFVRTRQQDIVNAANDLPATQAADAWIHGKRRQGISESEEQLLQSIDEMRSHMADAGVRPATILNSHPFEIRSIGKFCERHVIPACPLGQAYVAYTISTYDTDTVDKGEHFEARPILPIQIARDILQQHDTNNSAITGGLSIYMGENAPSPAKQEEHNLAVKKMEAHYRKLVQDADLEYRRTDKAGRKNITDIHRAAAKYLFHQRFITKLPEWIVAERAAVDILPVCPACGSEPKKGAFACGSCGWIVDSVGAYKAGAITASDVALTRASREQLEDAGLSALVKETSEERKARELAEVAPKRGPGRPPKVQEE